MKFNSLHRTFVLVILGRLSNGFVMRPMIRKHGLAISNTDININRPRSIVREPAGAESVFRRASSMRQKQFKKMKGVLRNNRVWNIRLRRSKQVALEEIDLWGVEKTRQGLSLPAWACNDPEEERRLAAMKIILEKDLQFLESKMINLGKMGRSVKVVEAFPDVYSDLRLLRFLRKDKVQDPVTAAVRYREYLQWREANQVDDIRAMVQSHLFNPPPELSIVGEFMPCDFQAKPSADGSVPVLLKVGAWDSEGIMSLMQSNKISLQTFLKYWMFMFESVHLHLYQESLKEKRMVFIDEVCDLKGMSMKQFTPGFVSTVLKPWLDLTQSNYPETAKRIVFLNPPKIMSIVWRMVTPLVSPGTVAKVCFRSKFKGCGEVFIQENYSQTDSNVKSLV